MKKQTKFGLVLAAAAVISVSVASLVSARGWVQQGADWYYVDSNNDYVTETIQSSGASKFYLGADGAMVRDYFLEDDGNGNTYYFGSNGAMVTNTWVAIESSVVENTGNYVPDNYWYYFQSSGKAMKGSTTAMKKATIDGKKYGFNADGQMAIGWVDEYGNTADPDQENPFEQATYYCGGDNDGALRSGWVTYYDGYDGQDGNKGDYVNLYFYFNPSNNKIVTNDTKKINGRTYVFDINGVMLSGWDVYEEGLLLQGKTTYFSGEDDGHQVKKGWVYAVPSESVDGDAYNDNEEKYMYFGSDGDIKRGDISKINGKYYCFDGHGIMKTGIIMWCTNNTGVDKYAGKIDLDYAKGADLAKKGWLQYDSDDHKDESGQDDYKIRVNKNGVVTDLQYAHSKTNLTEEYSKIKLHYFGEDGARRTGLNTIEFNDGNYVLNTNNSGDKGTVIDKKKYYSLGIALKADPDLRYGIYAASGSELRRQVAGDGGSYEDNLAQGKYKVLTSNGSLQRGNASAKKDANGNYWLIDKSTDILKGIYTENVKSGSGSVKSGFASVTYNYTVGDISETTTDPETGAIVRRTTPTNPSEGSSYTINNLSTDEVKEYTDGSVDRIFIRDDSWLRGKSWTAKISASPNRTVTFILNDRYDKEAYQGTFNSKQNVWMPFGVIDDGGNTQEDYEIGTEKLDNSYFLNCYIEP